MRRRGERGGRGETELFWVVRRLSTGDLCTIVTQVGAGVAEHMIQMLGNEMSQWPWTSQLSF